MRSISHGARRQKGAVMRLMVMMVSMTTSSGMPNDFSIDAEYCPRILDADSCGASDATMQMSTGVRKWADRSISITEIFIRDATRLYS
jgi:hypothetical protein